MNESDDDYSNACFVISPIGEKGSDVRKKSDQVLKHIIKPCVESRKLQAVRGDDIGEPGMITNQVIRMVINAPLVIADLTDHNANVFYELAVRHAARRPLVQIIDAKDKIPFDVAGYRTIPYTPSDLDSVEDCKTELDKQVRNAMSGAHEVDNPIVNAVRLDRLLKTGDPVGISNARLVGAVDRLELAVNRLVHMRQLGLVRDFTVDEVSLSTSRCRQLIKKLTRKGLDKDQAEALKHAFELHVLSILRLFQELGIDSGSGLESLKKE